jgi:hypothetical protein
LISLRSANQYCRSHRKRLGGDAAPKKPVGVHSRCHTVRGYGNVIQLPWIADKGTSNRTTIETSHKRREVCVGVGEQVQLRSRTLRYLKSTNATFSKNP